MTILTKGKCILQYIQCSPTASDFFVPTPIPCLGFHPRPKSGFTLLPLLRPQRAEEEVEEEEPLAHRRFGLVDMAQRYSFLGDKIPTRNGRSVLSLLDVFSVDDHTICADTSLPT